MNAQLIDAESGAHLWADRFDTNRANLAETQSEIIGRLAWTLNIALLSDASRRIEHENAVDPEARDPVMRGWAWWYGPQSPKAAQEALGAFEHALKIDPRSSDARIGIARLLVAKLTTAWSSSSFQQDEVQQTVAQAERLLIEPGRQCAEPHRACGSSLATTTRTRRRAMPRCGLTGPRNLRKITHCAGGDLANFQSDHQVTGKV